MTTLYKKVGKRYKPFLSRTNGSGKRCATPTRLDDKLARIGRAKRYATRSA